MASGPGAAIPVALAPAEDVVATAVDPVVLAVDVPVIRDAVDVGVYAASRRKHISTRLNPLGPFSIIDAQL